MNISIKTIPQKYLAYGFIVFYFLLNIFQANYTELTSDEGYYWYLSAHLNWGYYDQPPLLPFLIYAGRHLFAGELGVRFTNVLLMSMGLVFLFKLLEKDEQWQSHLYLIVLSLPLFNYISIVVFPDTPLVAISMVYLFFYKRFLEKDDFVSALILGVSLAAMLYAKYHAVLIVLFVLMSNISLLRNKKFVLSLFIAAALYVPHLYWQYTHDFVSIKYHLLSRSNGFNISFLTEYPSVQFLVLGPALIIVPFIYKAKDLFERALKCVLIGTLSFFLLATFKGYVQFHWTSIVLFPLIILSYNYYSGRKKKLFLYLTLPTLLLVLFLRTYLAIKILPTNTFNHVDYFHGRHAWAEDIQHIAGDKPVVFENQLREAPLYSFYSGKQSVALYGGDSKKTQYQLWNAEDGLQGKDVVIIKDGGCSSCTKLVTKMGKEITYMPYAHFASYQNIRILLKNVTALSDTTVRVQLEIANHRDRPLLFAKNNFGGQPLLLCKVYAGAGKKDTTLTVRALSAEDSIAPHSRRVIAGEISLDGIRQGRTCSFGFDDGVFRPSSNSKRYAL